MTEEQKARAYNIGVQDVSNMYKEFSQLIEADHLKNHADVVETMEVEIVNPLNSLGIRILEIESGIEELELELTQEEVELGPVPTVFVSNDPIELCGQCPAISTHVAHTIRDRLITDEAFCQDHWNQKRRNYEQ